MVRRYEIEVSATANRDIDKIQDFIALDSPGTATDFTLRLLARIESLGGYPRRHPRVAGARSLGKDVRAMVVTPYKVYYTVSGNVVRVLHVRHGARGAPDQD